MKMGVQIYSFLACLPAKPGEEAHHGPRTHSAPMWPVPPEDKQVDVTLADASLRLLLTGTEAQLWPARIAALLTCYSQHKVLAWLGQGLVRSIATLYSPMVSHTAAQTWRDLWQGHGGHDEALVIPLRLLDAAVRYRESHDRRVLLRLPMEERTVLEQVLGERVSETA